MSASQPVAGTAYPSPQAVMARLLTGYWISQAIYAAAKFGIADHLKDGPKTVGELATASSTNPDALYRLLRALASAMFPQAIVTIRSSRPARWLVSK